MAEETEPASESPDEPWPRIERPPGGKYRCITGRLVVLRDADGVRVDMSPGLPLKNQLKTFALLLVVGGVVAFIPWVMEMEGALADDHGVA